MHDAALSRPWRDDAHAAGLVGLAHLTSHFFQLLLPPIYPWLMRDFGIGFTEAGFLATVFFAISGSGQALAGFAVDRIGAYRMLLVGIALLIGAATVLGLSHSYTGLVLTAALAGAGNAMFHPADFTILNRHVSSSRLGHAFAMHALSGNLGWAAGASFMGAVTAMAGWHNAAFGAAALAALVWLFLLSRRSVLDDIGEAHPRAHQGEGPAETGQFAFLRSAVVWWCFAYFFLSTGAGGALQNFAPAMLMHVHLLSLALGTMGLTTYLLGSAAGTILGGFVAGSAQRSERVVAVAMFLAALLCLLLALGPLPAAVLLPAMFLLGVSSGTSAPSRDLLVRRAATARYGAASYGRVYGFVYSGLDTGLAIGPVVVGHLLDDGSFSSGLLVCSALLTGAMWVALRVGRQQ